jgi:aldehyde dehydrogenase (NAD+)
MTNKTDQLSHDEAALSELYQGQQAFFSSGATRPYEFRRGMLGTLKSAIKRHEARLNAALHADLRKSAFESYVTEIGPTLAEIDHTLKYLRTWMQPQRVATPLFLIPSSSKVFQDPLGVTLTISPWNYPVNLSLSVLAAAMAGGNTSILKTSELAPHTAAAITALIEECFEPEYVAVINGPGYLLGPALLERFHFDHVFFTGSPAVGKKIMAAAASQLSPVTLELGGKSPCIVAADANLEYAARKIVWGKLLNAGQTCVAPDYVLVHQSVKEQLIEALKEHLVRMFGKTPQQSADYGRIINHRRFEALTGYLSQGRIVHGGDADATDFYISPTLMTDVPLDSPLMQDEIFGPILPILGFSELSEVVHQVEKHAYPLAAYLFTNSKATANFFTKNLRFGGGCVNNCLVHLGNPNLPFGGVGYSGMGQYHGHAGFKTFTRPKSLVSSPSWFDAPLIYPPYKNNLRWLKRLL